MQLAVEGTKLQVIMPGKPCPSSSKKPLGLFRKEGMMLNTRTLSFTVAAALLDQELQKWKKWNIQPAGLQ